MSMVARDVMKTPVVSVSPDARLTELEDTLIARRIGGAPVVEGGRLVGIVSRSDIVRYFTVRRAMVGVLGHRPPKEKDEDGEPWESAETHLFVRDIMARDPVVVRPDAPVAEVARLMVTRHVHRVLVTENDHVLGLISALDLAQLVADGKLGEQ